MDQENFTVLENKAIGRNISMYRKLRGMKAVEVAEQLGMKEPTYTRYERGEGAITVDLIQSIAEILRVDPLMVLSFPPSNFIENSSHFAVRDYHNHQSNEQTQVLVTLMQNIAALNERLLAFLENKKSS